MCPVLVSPCLVQFWTTKHEIILEKLATLRDVLTVVPPVTSSESASSTPAAATAPPGHVGDDEGEGSEALTVDSDGYIVRRRPAATSKPNGKVLKTSTKPKQQSKGKGESHGRGKGSKA